MDRRKSLKALFIGTISTGVLVEACKPSDKKAAVADPATTVSGINRMPEEKEHEKQVEAAGNYFNDDEMKTITILGDIIIPKDDVSGSASEAKVPDFIQYIVNEKIEHQVPMRGGLRWLDLKCIELYGNAFSECSSEQQIQMVNAIAYPKKATKEMAQGVTFFSLMRNLTATGFYTSEIGGKDVGYMGNRPNKWNGIPADVLKQYNIAYTEKELKECINYDQA